MTHPSHAELARVVSDHASQLAASLVHLVGDFAAAEDLVQDAIEAALAHWPAQGIPEQPDAWLYTRIAAAPTAASTGHPQAAG